MYVEHVIEPFENKYGVEVTTTTGVEWFTLSKLRQEVKSGSPRVDVVQVTVSDYIRGRNMDLWEELDYSNIPESENVGEEFVASHGIGFETYGMGLVFNTKTGKPTPTSLEDLWDSNYNVAIGKTHQQYFVPMVNYMLTGQFTPVDEEAVFDKLDELKDNMVTTTASHAEKRNLIANNEIDLSEAFNNRVGKMLDDGLKVKYISFPSAFVGVDYWGIVKGTSQKELAEEFINFSLATAQQAANARNQYLGPTNKGVELEEDFVAKKGIPYGESARKLSLDDYEYIAENLGSWTKQWQRWLAR